MANSKVFLEPLKWITSVTLKSPRHLLFRAYMLVPNVSGVSLKMWQWKKKVMTKETGRCFIWKRWTDFRLQVSCEWPSVQKLEPRFAGPALPPGCLECEYSLIQLKTHLNLTLPSKIKKKKKNNSTWSEKSDGHSTVFSVEMSVTSNIGPGGLVKVSPMLSFVFTVKEHAHKIYRLGLGDS